MREPKCGFRRYEAAARKLHYRLAQQLTMQSIETATISGGNGRVGWVIPTQTIRQFNNGHS
jgi:hypothetical protein